MYKAILSTVLVCVINITGVLAQDIKIFKTSDFDLNGNVKKCMVFTDYGKEAYEFNKAGWLTKSVTHYSDQDYEITYYKYEGERLLEKRLESYRDNVFDKSTSIANFYYVDTLQNKKVTEKIVSYSKDFFEQYEYFYNANDTLVKLKRTNDSGTDVTTVLYENNENEQLKKVLVNDELVETVKTSQILVPEKETIIKILTTTFLNDVAHKANEIVYTHHGKIKLETNYRFNEVTNKLEKIMTSVFEYTKDGVLAKKTITQNNEEHVQEFLFQFDGTENNNWIKKIITPDNSYETRQITYYSELLKNDKP